MIPCVKRLEDSLSISHPRHFCYQFRREVLGPHHFIHAQEVYLQHFLGQRFSLDLNDNPSDEPDHFIGGPNPDTDQIIRVHAGGMQCPLEQARAIVEPKHTIVVFDIIQILEIINLH